ncbi:MAG: CoA-binding protein [Gemmatimonadota bacterium]|nr:CoA-binding protein [Gemmatimonadota bacterium]MDH3422920.1 CoA-binding protein [Gemmatimonadota bacterium]
MDTLPEVGRVLAASSDSSNPSPEELHELLERIERIGVIGLSRFPEKAARRVPSYLGAKGYDLIPINPNAERIFGKAAFDTLAKVPDELDLVLIFRPSEAAGDFVEQAARRPERPAIWLLEGILAPREAAAARAEGLTVVQDLCIFKVHRALFG